MKNNPLLSLAALGRILAAAAGCKTGSTAKHEYVPAPGAKPATVYVADFELGAESVKHEEGMLPSGGSGPVSRVGNRLSGAPTDPAARARQIVDLMSDSLVKQLTKSGLSATRLGPGYALPAEGWLVRGIFLEVQEGNRLKRAMIGLGQGQTDIQVVSAIHELSKGAPPSLYDIAASANSGTKVGAAPTLVLGPYGAAARYVMAGKDLEKNVKQTAIQMADQITQHIQNVKAAP